MKLGCWEPLVDAEPVRAHVREILGTGMTIPVLCRVRGLPDGALRHLLYGKPDGSGVRRPSRTVLKETADALMPYWPVLDDYHDGARIDPCGFRRRLQALMVRGITLQVIAAPLDLDPEWLRALLRAERVTARVARAVRDLYDEWWDWTPEELGVPADRAAQLVAYYTAKGYVPAWAWGDDTIDDPAAAPAWDVEPPEPCRDEDAVGRWLLGESLVLDNAGRREALQYLMEWTPLTIGEIAKRMGVCGDTVQRRWAKITAEAKDAGVEVPRRRVYVPPERPRPLRAGEMRRAA